MPDLPAATLVAAYIQLNCIREYVEKIQSSLRTVTLPSDRVAKNFYEASGITARVLLMEEKREHNRYRP